MEKEIKINIPDNGDIRFYAFRNKKWAAFDADPNEPGFGAFVSERAKTIAYELTK